MGQDTALGTPINLFTSIRANIVSINTINLKTMIILKSIIVFKDQRFYIPT